MLQMRSMSFLQFPLFAFILSAIISVACWANDDSQSPYSHRILLVEFDSHASIELETWQQEMSHRIQASHQSLSSQFFERLQDHLVFAGFLVLVDNQNASALKNELNQDVHSQVLDLEAVVRLKIKTATESAKNLISMQNRDFQTSFEESSIAYRIAMEQEISFMAGLERHGSLMKKKIKVSKSILNEAVQRTILDLDAIAQTLRELRLPLEMRDLHQVVSRLGMQMYDTRLMLSRKFDLTHPQDLRFLFSFLAHPFQNNFSYAEKVDIIRESLATNAIPRHYIFNALADHDVAARSLFADAIADYWQTPAGSKQIFSDIRELFSMANVSQFLFLEPRMRYLSGSIQAVSTWLMTSTHSQLSFQEQKEVLKLVKALRTNQSFFDSRTRAYDPGLEGSLSFMEGLVASAGQFRCEYVLRKTLKYRL